MENHITIKRLGNREELRQKYDLTKGGDGGALYLTSFDDGSEVILPISYSARNDYKSHNWNRVHDCDFTENNYASDLLYVILDKKGVRWQVGFGSDRLRDSYNLNVLCKTVPKQALSYLRNEHEEIAGKILDHLWHMKDETNAQFFLKAAIANRNHTLFFYDSQRIPEKLLNYVGPKGDTLLSYHTTYNDVEEISFLLKDPRLSIATIKAKDEYGHSVQSYAEEHRPGSGIAEMIQQAVKERRYKQLKSFFNASNSIVVKSFMKIGRKDLSQKRNAIPSNDLSKR